jgi:hypothetical protein
MTAGLSNVATEKCRSRRGGRRKATYHSVAVSHGPANGLYGRGSCERVGSAWFVALISVRGRSDSPATCGSMSSPFQGASFGACAIKNRTRRQRHGSLLRNWPRRRLSVPTTVWALLRKSRGASSWPPRRRVAAAGQMMRIRSMQTRDRLRLYRLRAQARKMT